MSQELVVNNFLKNIHPKNSSPYIYFNNSIYPTIFPYLEKSRDSIQEVNINTDTMRQGKAKPRNKIIGDWNSGWNRKTHPTTNRKRPQNERRENFNVRS